jgi:hypothetical protein
LLEDFASSPEKPSGDPAISEGCDEDNDHQLQMTPTKDSASERTPTRKRRSSRQKLLEAAASRLQHLSDEQLTSLTVLMGGSKSDDVSNCSSSERSSEESPPKARATSAPAGSRVEYYENTPQYPELRKKRLSGQRVATPMKVRFEGEEEEPNGSDDDIPMASSHGLSSIGVKASRRLSRGPTGEIVPVSHDDSPKKSEEHPSLSRTTSESELTLSEAASAVVGGATGAVYGGVTGAAIGLVPALFTFGLSIPACAIAGATYQGYKGIVNSIDRSRDTGSESSNVRTSSEPPMSARR